MKKLIRSCAHGAAAAAALIALAIGCGPKAAKDAPAVGTAGVTLTGATSPDTAIAVTGPEMTQSVPPPPQVAGNPNTMEIVHKLPPIPANVTGRHKHLKLVKYESKYWLQDVDHHCYLAARDRSGHFYPACYNPSGGSVYPLYYDSARDDYYRACSDRDHHFFRCYEDEPSYVYYYDPNPIYDRSGHGWSAEYEPEIEAPVYSADWGESIPVLQVSLFVFPQWHSQWWVQGGWSTGGDCFVDLSFGRPSFDYYAMPSGYAFTYANTLYDSNPEWRTNPGWYQHASFDQAAYQRGDYRSVSGYGRTAAAGTLASVYDGSRAFHNGNRAAERTSSQNVTHAAGGTASRSFAGGGEVAAAHSGGPGHTISDGGDSAMRRESGTNRTATSGLSHVAAGGHTRPTPHTAVSNANKSTHTISTSTRRVSSLGNHTAPHVNSSAQSSVRSAQRGDGQHISSAPRSGGEGQHISSAPRSSGGGQHISSAPRSSGGGQHISSAPRSSGGGQQTSKGQHSSSPDDHKR